MEIGKRLLGELIEPAGFGVPLDPLVRNALPRIRLTTRGTL
jgi:hypothetical protein